ncbi:hypothetical protein ACFQY0_05780 [Haloferula chungangensis]|uniref:DUF4157 domain-containing protein n=1 Tax=Haloferula chungangensis TaxID=1048331 RepID=A0ABW2L591_9BACT
MRSFSAKVLADALAPTLARWSQSRERSILRSGERLPEASIQFATELGIRSPESLRLEISEIIPSPIPPALITLASRLGIPLFSPAGMCLGRGISATSRDPGLIRHELVHTLQYQQLGGHRPFMWRYVYEILKVGYVAAPLEIEARNRSAPNPTPSGPT